MWRAIWKLAFRRTRLAYLLVATSLAAYVLLKTDPLGESDPVAVLLGAALGCVLAVCLFRDPPGVAAFVFSRPFSRGRLFLYRWLIGLGLQAVTISALVGLLAGGVRLWLHVSFYGHPLWYPMVRWYELSVVWPVGLASLFAYQATLLVMVRNRLIRDSRGEGCRWIRRLGTIVDVVLIAAFALAALELAIWTVYTGGISVVSPWVAPLVIPYLALLTVMSTLGALYCYRQLEVDA